MRPPAAMTRWQGTSCLAQPRRMLPTARAARGLAASPGDVAEGAPAGGKEAVAGDVRPRAAAHDVADGAGAPRLTRQPGDVAVGRHAARRNAAHHAQHAGLESPRDLHRSASGSKSKSFGSSGATIDDGRSVSAASISHRFISYGKSSRRPVRPISTRTCGRYGSAALTFNTTAISPVFSLTTLPVG